MGGTAVATFTTVPLADACGEDAPFLLVAAVLVGYAALAWALLRDGPDRHPRRRSAWRGDPRRVPARGHLVALLPVRGGVRRLRRVQRLLARVPADAYELTSADAGVRTAGFVLVAIAARPLGGWLSDRFHPSPVLVTVFGAAAVLAVVPRSPRRWSRWPRSPSSAWPGAWGPRPARSSPSSASSRRPTRSVRSPDRRRRRRPRRLLPAAGDGRVYALDGSYAIGLMLLSDVALAAAVFTWLRLSRRTAARA